LKGSEKAVYIYLNGEIVKQEEATISAYDHGYLYGLGLFETMRTYHRHPFLLDDHLDRIQSSLHHVNMMHTFKRDDVLAIIQHLCKVNQLEDSYIRLNISAGVGDIGLQTEPYRELTIIVFQKTLPTHRFIAKEAVILKQRRNSPETTMRLKSHHYLNNIAAKREIGADPKKEGIFLTEEGHLAEGIVSNLFWIKNNILYTPAIETGILNGVTRRFIMRLANIYQLSIEEGFYPPNVLKEAEEVFFTNSIQEIIPVSRISGQDYPGCDGMWTRKLYGAYCQYAESLFSREQLLS
jgi:4-amino-4-deoxychorismate lyase